jgi:hypothetical protein
MSVGEDEDKIELSTKDITKLVAKLEDLSNAAWVAAQSLKMIVKAGEGIEKARKMMCSPPEVKSEPSKEAQDSLDAWLGDV